MEKVSNTQPSVVLSKTKDGYEKIIFNLSLKTLFTLLCSFLFSGARLFASMTPFGVAFYGAVFTKSSWVAPFLVSLLSAIFLKNGNSVLNIAVFSLVTVLLGFFDVQNQKTKKSVLVCGAFFCLKLIFTVLSGYVIYDIFALILESAVVFALTYVFEISFPVITSLKKRNFISTSESICTMVFLALVAMSLSDYPSIRGINLSGTVAIFMIYIFSLGGINGGALVLSVLMGTVGSLKTDSFSVITGTYAFGAFLGSALSHHGKIAVVLGFVIANTFSSIVLTDAAYVSVNIYDSLVAAVIFWLLPQKYCLYFSQIFSKNIRSGQPSSPFSRISRNHILSRLDEMSKSFSDLSIVYGSVLVQRKLGKEYVLSKFKETKKLACVGCSKSTQCFGRESSKGYVHMTKMLETAFKNGKITPQTMPSEFRSNCQRCDSFAEKFNSMFNVIKTERLWLSKLNDSRMLISSQLQAISDALDAEKKRCMLKVDFNLEEDLWAEFDKLSLPVSDVSAQKDDSGDFFVEISFGNDEISHKNTCILQKTIEQILCRKVGFSYPKCENGLNTICFFPMRCFTVDAGFASVPKTGEKISGDSFRLINPDGKNYYAVLSDGMGSGTNANEESTTAVCLMEKFIKAGFDSDTAVRLINSSLLLKSAKDSFSTLDICNVDLVNGTLSFTKLGAARSYIKKVDDITVVNACTLPAGILKDIEVENHYISINGDTTVVIVSDGIADIELKNKLYEGWIKEELLNLKTSNPQIVASRLCHKAQSLQEGSITDDMTVIVLNIKKV